MKKMLGKKLGHTNVSARIVSRACLCGVMCTVGKINTMQMVYSASEIG